MRLSIDSPGGDDVLPSAVSVNQRFAAVTSCTPIGTYNLANCLGIVVHNRLGSVGCVAHVEATADIKSYLIAVDKTLKKIMCQLNAKGGDKGSLSVVLLGNANGISSDFNSGLKSQIYDIVGDGARLNRFDFADLRNGGARGLIGQTLGFSGMFGGCIYTPKKECLQLLTLKGISSNNSPQGVIQFQIQP